eukprot:scaffold8531_cov130-Isochrysis_galbana.AAC.13
MGSSIWCRAKRVGGEPCASEAGHPRPLFGGWWCVRWGVRNWTCTGAGWGASTARVGMHSLR